MGEPAKASESITRLRALALVLVFVLAAVLCAAGLLNHRVDSDALWHVKTGEWMVSHRQLPSTDVFSWYGMERHSRWLTHEWLFDVGIYEAWKAGGFPLVYGLTAGLVGAFALAAFALARQRTGRWGGSLIVALVSLLGVAPFIAPRPHIVTFPLLTLTALLLEKRRWPLALIVMLVGVNVHGAMYPIYLLLFAFYALPAMPAAFPAACVVVLATPLGLGLVRYPLFAFESQVSRFQEYAPTVLSEMPVLLATFLAILVLLDRERIPWREALLALALGFLALRGVRHSALFFAIALPLLAPYLRLPRRQGGSRELEATLPSTRLDAILVAALALAVAASASRLVGKTVDVDREYPKGALQYARSHGLERTWNDWNDGGYLIFNDWPTMIDGRADPFSPFFDREITLASEYVEVYTLEADVRPFLDKYRIEYLLVERKTPLNRVYEQSAQFRPVYRDPGYIIYRYSREASSGVGGG